jgi:hypothetical protein
VAVADLAGGAWPARGRAAVVQLVDKATEKSTTSDRIRLLLDAASPTSTPSPPP